MTTTATRPGEARPRAAIAAKTLRTDRWWFAPLLTVTLLVIWVALRHGPRVHAEVVLGRRLPLPHAVLFAVRVDGLRAGRRRVRPVPAGLARSSRTPRSRLPFLLLFRLTCYYYRKAYYRSFWASPPACAVPDGHQKYTGETRFPLIFQNAHRYFFYAAVLISLINTWDAIRAFHSPRGLRLRSRQHHPAGQRGDALGVHGVLPLLPAHRRRPAQALLQASPPLPGLEVSSRSSTPGTCSWPGSPSARWC